MLTGVKNLIIDFGGVLINLNRPRCIEAFNKLGVTDVEEMINPFLQQGAFLALEQGEITPAAFRNEIRGKSKKQLSDKQLDDAWNSFLMDIPHYKLDLLLELRQHYVVYLLSNTNDIHWQWACTNSFPYKSFQVEDYFEKIYLSYKMKQVKPSTAIFETLLSDAEIRPEETLLIDDAAANCQTAAALGLKTYMPKAGEDWGHLFK